MFSKEDFYGSGHNSIDDFLMHMLKDEFLEYIGDDESKSTAKLTFELLKNEEEIEIKSEITGNTSSIITLLVLLSMKERKINHILSSVAKMMDAINMMKEDIMGKSGIDENLN